MNRFSLSLFTLVFFFITVPGFSEPGTNQAALSVLGQSDFVSDDSPNPPTATGLNEPEGVAVDPTTGKVFISDSSNNRVLRFATLAAYRTGAAAEVVFGQTDMISKGDGVSGTEMDYPVSIAVDNTGTLWVADSGNHRVIRFDNASSIATNGAAADGVLGQENFMTATPTNQAGPRFSDMDDPTCVTVDAGGTLWVVDNNNDRILRFDNARGKSNGANADAVLGQVDLESFNVAGNTASRFDNPYGASIDRSGRLWVADEGNHRVLRFDNAATKANGAAADAVLGQTDFTSTSEGTSDSKFDSPYYIFASPTGTVWVTDYGNSRVLGFKAAAAKADGAAANVVIGQVDFDSKNADAPTNRGLSGPSQVAVGKDGSLFVADYDEHRVLRFSDPVVVKTPRKAQARKGKSTIKGTSSGATRVEYKIPGQGGYRKAKGRAARWKVKARKLTRRTIVMRVRGIAFDGLKSRVRKTKIKMR